MSSSSLADVVPLWVKLCGSLAPIASIVVFLAPMPTIRSILRDKTVGSLPLLPYSSMIASSFLWTMYGILKSEPKVYASNGIGFCCALYYTRSFLTYAPKASSTLPGTVAQHLIGCATVASATIVVAASGHPTASDWIGKAGVVFCVALFASPLAALKTVLQTRSASSIPLPFTIACAINCACWVVWGWFAMHDSNIYVPNILGLAFSLTQLALKLHFPGGGSAYPSRSGSPVAFDPQQQQQQQRLLVEPSLLPK